MHALETSLRRICILVLPTLVTAVPVQGRAQASQPVMEPSEPPADGWQRGLEVGGLVANFLNVGCGRKLLKRQDEKSFGAAYDNNKNWHIGLTSAALGINLVSAWQQWKVNTERPHLEFRHAAHNTLFWANIAGLIASAGLGVASTRTRAHGDLRTAHNLAVAMGVVGFGSFGATAFDLVLFGGHDNASIIGYKIAL